MGPTHLGVVDETRCEWMTSKIRTDVTYPKLSRLQVRVTQVWNQVRDTEKTIRATKCSIFIHPSCGRHSLMSVLEICETNYMDLDESAVIIFVHQCWSCHWASLCSCFLHFCEDDEEEVHGLWRLQFSLLFIARATVFFCPPWSFWGSRYFSSSLYLSERRLLLFHDLLVIELQCLFKSRVIHSCKVVRKCQSLKHDFDSWSLCLR